MDKIIPTSVVVGVQAAKLVRVVTDTTVSATKVVAKGSANGARGFFAGFKAGWQR